MNKNALFEYFWARILKKLLSYLKSTPSNLSISKVSPKNKNAKIWDKKCLIWVLLGRNLKTILSYLKSAPSNLFCCKISWKMKKYLNLEPKIPYLGIFELEISKTIVIFGISILEFVKYSDTLIQWFLFLVAIFLKYRGSLFL